MKKLYRKAKKGFKKRITNLFNYKRDLFAKNNSILPKALKPKKDSGNFKRLRTSLKKAKEQVKPTIVETLSKTKSPEKEKVRGSILRNSFGKAKEKIKGLQIKSFKKKKVIGSKKLAVLLTATTMVALVPLFNLAPLPALAATSTCVFVINFIMVKSVKKFLKQHKPSSKVKNVSLEKADKKCNSLDLI